MQCMAGQQRQLTNAQRKELQAESQRLGKALVTVNLGKAGMTERFIQSLLDAQAANQLVKVRAPGRGGFLLWWLVSWACVSSLLFTRFNYRYITH